MPSAKKTRISNQVLLIAFLGLLGMLALGVVIWLETVFKKPLQDQANLAQFRMQTVEEIRYQFLNARRREEDFLIRLDSKYVASHGEIAAGIQSSLAELRDGLPSDDPLLTAIDSVSGGVPPTKNNSIRSRTSGIRSA